jgi:hypothetical protein
MQFKKLDEKQLAYLAGFLEADGSILVQLVKGPYKYNYAVRISVVFYQRKDRH